MNDMSVADLCRNVYRPIKGTFRIFKPTPKTPVEQSVTEMIHEAKKQNCLILSEFKGIPVMVNGESTVSGVMNAYEKEIKSRLDKNKPMRKFVINLKETYVMNLAPGSDIITTTDNMINVANALNGIVFTKFNNVPIVVNQHSTREGVIDGFVAEINQRSAEYKRSPEAQKQAIEEKRREIEDYKLGLHVDELIKNEELDIVSPIHFNKLKTNAEREGMGSVIEVGTRWGRLMQIEMKKQNKTSLTKEIAETTYKMAEAGKSDYKLSGSTYGMARNMLMVCWKNGRELAQIQQFNVLEVDKVRQEVQSAEKGNNKIIQTKQKTR